MDAAVEIDPRIERLAVDLTAGHAVAESADAGHDAIRIQKSQFGGLREADGASIEGAADGQEVLAAPW